MQKSDGAVRSPQTLPTGLALLLLLVFCAALVPNFTRIELKEGRLFGAPIDILHRGAPVMLLAIGMTLVIATRGIDLSVGSVMAISGAVSALLLTRSSLSVPAIVAAALGVSVVLGLWNGSLVAFLKIQPIVATLILMVAGRGLAQLLTDGQIITFENEAFEFIGTGALFALPFTVFIVAGVLLLVVFLARKTIIGIYIESVGSNETASVYCGINAGMIKLFAYAVSGLCSGTAGLIAAADIKAADASTAGLYLELDAILSVVIGGTALSGGRFNLAGSILGALIIQTLTTAILMKAIGVQFTLIVKALAIIPISLMQSPAFRERVLAVLKAMRSS